ILSLQVIGQLFKDFVISACDRVKERSSEVDLYHAAVLCQRTNHVIRHIPFETWSKVTTRRVRGNDGNAGCTYHIVEGAVGYVRDIHHNANPVHFPDNLDTEGA